MVKTKLRGVVGDGGQVLEMHFQESTMNGRKDTAKKVPCS